MRKIISILIIIVATAFLTGCFQIKQQPDNSYPVVVKAKHFFPKHVETTSIFYPARVEKIPILKLFNYEKEILPDRYVVEIFDNTDGYYHFIIVKKVFWDEVEPGDTLCYNDTARILKFPE